MVVRGIPAHSEGILGGSRDYTMSFYFHSIFSQTPLFGVQLHIDAPVGLATFHASTCDVNNPSIAPSGVMASIVHNADRSCVHIADGCSPARRWTR